MTLTIQDVMAIAVPLVLGLAWILRLEGRIDVTDSRYQNIIARLDRIEKKQDHE